VTPLGIGPGTVRLVAQRLNHDATPGPGLAKGVEYFKGGEMCLPAKTVDSYKKFLNVKRPMPCYTIRAECKVNKCLERSAGPDY